MLLSCREKFAPAWTLSRGIPLVLGVGNYPDQSEAQHEELITTAESVHFETPDS